MSIDLNFSGISDDSDASAYSIISRDSSYQNSLIWDSEDSRPAGPSPPSSDNSDESQDSDISVTPSSLVGQLDTTDDFAIMESPLTADDSDATRFSDDTVILDGDRSPPESPIEYHPASPHHDAPAPYDPESPPHAPGSPQYRPETISGSPVLEPGGFRGFDHPARHNTARDDLTRLINERNRSRDAEEVQIIHEIIQIPGESHDPSPAAEPTSPQRIPHVMDIVSVPNKTTIPTVKASVPELNTSTLSEGDEGSLCTICMDPLTNSGPHRVACLRCGHIFGRSCVERWIKVGCNSGVKRCPTCNKRACIRDIRILFLPKVIPLDTIEKDRLIMEKEELAMQKKVVELELTRTKLQSDLNSQKYKEKIHILKQELLEAVTTIESLRQGKEVPITGTNVKREISKPELLQTVEITKEGGCRVMAFNPFLKDLVISQPSGNTIFAGFGVRVLNSVDFTPTRFIYLHQKMIRDLCFHAEDRDLLLSASLDNSAKLLDIASSTTVHTFKVESPLWSCCWDLSNPHLLLLGGQLGKVYQFDRRMMDHSVNMWENNNPTPVVALASAPSVASTPFPQGGFISCRLNCAFAYARQGEKYSSQDLQLEGPFMSMRYDSMTQTLLSASRPSSRCPYGRISLNLVDNDGQGNVCLPKIHSFNCGSSARVMSRMTTLPVLSDSLVIGHHESGRSINMWSSKTGELVYSVPIKEPVIDFTNLSMTNNYHLAALSEKKVCIYKIP